jgi:hypothetical protein
MLGRNNSEERVKIFYIITHIVSYPKENAKEMETKLFRKKTANYEGVTIMCRKWPGD